MKYRYLLFDMDDTLFDFQASELAAFCQVMESNKIAFSEELYAGYREENSKLWRAYEAGQIEKEVIFANRFGRMLERFGLAGDGILMEQQYRTGLGEGSHLMPDAKEVLDELVKRYSLYVVTNGVGHTQRKRLEDSGLRGYFQEVFISEEIGAAKPSAVYFDYVKEHIPGFTADQALIIGDSLGSDIVGGFKAGIDTCWFSQGDAGEMREFVNWQIGGLKELLVRL